jgi:hypothetical protein
MMMNEEQLVEWELAGETEVLGENPTQCYFVHHKFYMSLPGLEVGRPLWEVGNWAMARPAFYIRFERN